jgi:murein DD-endopeptidase MepM/ murein hydrolase activator NlpD
MEGRNLLTGLKFARAAYVMFAAAVLLALLKLGVFGAHPLFLSIVPTESVAKAAEPVTGQEASEDEVLDLPEADGLTSGSVGSLLSLASRVSNLPSGEESARTKEPSRDDTPVFYRPSSSGKDRGNGGEPVCGNLSGFPKSSRAVFPLSSDYFDSYENTWGAARPQGGHEGTDLMSPTGTPEFAITDGTIVPVKGANKVGWNTLGGYTVMLEAAYDAGPIKKGDLFYYAHMDEKSTLKLGTKVRTGQQIGVVGDTGEGREATRGKFPPHLHFGWYDTGSADSRTNLESGAMDPYPLLTWLEANGGAVTGGTDASYCEAPQEPALDSTSTSSDLDTGDRNDTWPSPVVGESQETSAHYPERKPGDGNGPEEKSDGTKAKTEEANATGEDTTASPADEPDKDGGPGNESRVVSTTGGRELASGGARLSGVSAKDSSLQASIRDRLRTLLMAPSPPDTASRRYYVSALMDMLHKAEKEDERDERDADKPDKKKQADSKKQRGQKKPSKQTQGGKQPQKARSAPETTSGQSRSGDEDAGKALTSGKDPKESPAKAAPKERTSLDKEMPR